MYFREEYKSGACPPAPIIHGQMSNCHNPSRVFELTREFVIELGMVLPGSLVTMSVECSSGTGVVQGRALDNR